MTSKFLSTSSPSNFHDLSKLPFRNDDLCYLSHTFNSHLSAFLYASPPRPFGDFNGVPPSQLFPLPPPSSQPPCHPMIFHNVPPADFCYGPHLNFFVPPPLPPPTPPLLPLQNKIINQVNYYFSDENLVKDIFLRQHMDVNGWVPLRLVAGFNRMKLLTLDIHLISLTLQRSSFVEVRYGKIRKRENWGRWLLPRLSSFKFTT